MFTLSKDVSAENSLRLESDDNHEILLKLIHFYLKLIRT